MCIHMSSNHMTDLMNTHLIPWYKTTEFSKADYRNLTHVTIVWLEMWMTVYDWTDLPEFHLYSAVELNEPRLEMQVLAVWVIDVNRTLLVLMFVDMAEVSAQLSTHAYLFFLSFVHLSAKWLTIVYSSFIHLSALLSVINFCKQVIWKTNWESL